jgi:iron(III) transport system permease protein
MSLRRALPALLLAVPLFAYIVYPLGITLSESVTLNVADYRASRMGWPVDEQPIAAPLRTVFGDSTTREAIFGTLKLSVLTVLCGGAWGLALVLLWWRREFPGRRYFALLGYAPIIMPPLVGTLSFFRLIGEVGSLWRWIPLSGGQPWVDGFGQVLILHTYSFGLYTYAYVAAALEDSDTSREEAARGLGAGTFRTFCTAVFPVIRAPLLASALLTFMAAAASFSAPYVLDNNGRYLTVEIVKNDGEPGIQRAMTVVLAAISLAALPAFLLFNRQWHGVGDVALGVKGAARQQLRASSTPGKWTRLSLSILAAIILLAPPATVVANALAPNLRDPSASLFSQITSTEIDSLWRSTVYGISAAIIDVVLAVSIAMSLRRAPLFAALPVELAVMLAVALPGTAIGIALLSAFNGPSALTFGVPLGGTSAILILAYSIRNLPLAVRPARAALESVGGDLERAAQSLGAGKMRTLMRVTLPLIFPSLLAAGLICFITGAGEFVASQLLYSALTRPVSVRIFEIFRTEPAPAFALSLCLMLLSIIAIAAAGLLQRRARRWL